MAEANAEIRPTNRTPKPLSAFGYYGPGPTTYCAACSSRRGDVEPFKGHRCKGCAAEMKAYDDARLMPDPLPFGSTLSYTVEHLLPRHGRPDYTAESRGDNRLLGWFVLPPFQRPPIWTLEQKVKLIESMWMGLPIGAYFLNKPEGYNDPTDLWLIDGQQRISAILDYLADAFPVFGYIWADLPEHEQRGFLSKVFPCVETRLNDPVVLEDLYNRLAYGGTPHEPAA